MLHPIRLPDSHVALTRTVELQARLMAWLCDQVTAPADISPQAAGLREPEVAEWLAWFIGMKGILASMQEMAQLPRNEKVALLARFASTQRFRECFWLHPPILVDWSVPLPRNEGEPLKTFFQGFYDIAFSNKRGLPYDAAGNPANPGLTRARYVTDFRAINFDRVCPGCDGDLNTGQEFDHWIGKAGHPCLSIHPENLVLFCHKCNSPEIKGQSPAYSDGPAPFDDWFHPWLRQAAGRFQVTLQLNKAIPTALDPLDDRRVANLDRLLDLTERWSLELDSQIKECLTVLEVLIEENQQADVAAASVRLGQDRSRSHKQVGKKPHTLIAKALLDQACATPSTIRDWLEEVRAKLGQRTSP